MRLGTLSWGIGEEEGQTPDEFLASISGSADGFSGCDLLLAAGLTLTRLPSAEAVLAATGGTPALYEVKGRDGDRNWLVTHEVGGSPRHTLVRHRQLAQRFDDYDGFQRVAETVGRRAGIIEFEGISLRFVLLICGENNSINPYAARSVFKRLSDEPAAAAGLRAVLGGLWVLLNPAHARYYPQVLPTGFGKVGEVRTAEDRVAGPTLRWLAERADGYRDGTTPPVAVLHVNNFDPRHPETEGYAAVGFGEAGVRGQPASGTVATADGPRPWRAGVFEIGTGSG